MTKMCTMLTCCFLGNDTKRWFLTNWGQDNNTQGVHEHCKLWKKFIVRWVRLWTTSKHEFLWDTSILRNLWNFRNLWKYFTVALHERKILRNMRQRNIKKPFESNGFSEIFYCGMTRLRNTSLVVFIQCQYTRTILRNKNIEQSLFKKHSKFQNFGEIFYCGMTRLRNTNLEVFMQCQHTRTMFKNKNVRQSLLKKYSKFQKFDEILLTQR